jgi:hypothetical protein
MKRWLLLLIPLGVIGFVAYEIYQIWYFLQLGRATLVIPF